MVLYTKVVINGVTVRDDKSGSNPKKIVKWNYSKDEDQPISEAEISAIKTIQDLVTLQNNQIVQIYTSPDNITYTRKFYGYIDSFKLEGALINIICKNEMYDLVRHNVNTIYDSSVSPTAGIISAIAEDIIETYGELDAVVQTSGSAEGETIDEFKCINTDCYERVNALREALNWVLYYDDENQQVRFEPNGFISSGVTLTTSDNVVGVPSWDVDTSHMINRLLVNGATQQTTITETGQIGVTSGWETGSILLTKTPDSTDVFVDASNPPTTQLEGGSKDASTGNDYWVDRENKKVIPVTSFTSSHYGIVTYIWSAPAPIEMENSESIENYGLFEKEVHLSDITSVADAETRATNILAKRSLPFFSCALLVKSNVDINVGELVTIQDNITDNAPNGDYMVARINYIYPSSYDEVEVGDKKWRMADWQEGTEARIKRLEEQFVRNQDLLRKLVQTTNSKAQNLLTPTPRYRQIFLRNIAGDTLIWGNPSFGTWGTFKWGDAATQGFILGHSEAGILGTSKLGSNASAEALEYCSQHLNTYTEKFVDDDFESTNTTADWSTTGSVDFTSGEIAESDPIDYNNGTITTAKLTSTEVSGSFTYEMTADGTNWETVTSGTAHTFTNSGTDLRWRATENAASTGEISQILIEDYH